ncbi:M48 family metalloprotease [Candidatus Halobeggiatoa sp. HSG11]|nr:M48 family metalloprotease [Candidatus Halobeggiatoa sp. HSG11]
MKYWFLILCLIQMPCLAVELPDIGISADVIMSSADEDKLGKAFIRQLRQHVEVIDDIQINDYLNVLGNHLVSYSENPTQNFHFFVIKNSSVNAFAVPGGFIGIHSGLIMTTRSEGELASVLSHEIAHVTQRHIARTIEASQRLTVPKIAALIAAAIVTSIAPQAGQAAFAAIMAGNIQMQINFTRIHEKEADRIGIQTLANAGFSPYEMPNFFERMQIANRNSTTNLPELLLTHPVTTNRIAEAHDRAAKYSPKLKTENPLYNLMRAKLLVSTTDNKVKLLRTLQKMLANENYRDEGAIRYGLALALLANRRTDGVQKQIDWLIKNDDDRVMYRILKARLALANNNNTQAIQEYDKVFQIYPHDKMLGLDYAEKLLQNNMAAKAKTVLTNISLSSNPYYYFLLAQANQLTGSKAEAYFALAENYYLQGQTAIAVENLKQALQNVKGDFYLATRIDARYKELQAELLEERSNK